MSYNATVYKVMIASPSDVSAERNIIRSVLAEWNVIHSETNKIVLLPIGWETHISPHMGESPQSYINEKILKDCDLLVGVFWTRIGTATDNYPSGTIEEIEEHIKTGKPTMLYFSEKPVEPGNIDQNQYKQLEKFRESCEKRGIFETFKDINDFKEKLFRQLQIKINEDEHFKIIKQSKIIESSEPTINIPRLSQEAQQLLKEASQDYDGMIMRISYSDGVAIQTNQKSFGEGNARERAKWEGALKELELEGLVESQGFKGEIYKVTREGYDVAELINL